MKIMDKLKIKIKIDKNLLVFLLVLLLIGIIVGSIFVKSLSVSDQELIKQHLNNFVDNIEEDKLDYLKTLKSNLLENIGFIFITWILGISVIGLPVVLVMFFSKCFIMGFSVGAILSVFKTKGILFSLIYVFPSQIISILFLLLLTMYAMSFSFKITYVIFRKKTLDFKVVMNKYFKILIIVLIVIIAMSFYDTYLVPKLLKSIILFIK